MAVISRATATTQSTTIRDEVAANANTATRVGGHLLDIVDSAIWGGEAGQTLNILTTGYLRLGTNPAQVTGGIGLPNDVWIQGHNSGNTVDRPLIKCTSGSNTLIGHNTATTLLQTDHLEFVIGAANTPASAGTIRAPNVLSMQVRNAAGSANLSLVACDASNVATFGNSSGASILNGNSSSIQHAGTTRIQANATGLGFFGVTPVARPAAYTPTNVTPDRSYDADLVVITELADVVGTLIADLQALGLLQ